jgi:large subunit ribosomal protein L21
MYAVVKTGGKQYQVAQGDVLRVEKLDVPVGDTVELDQVKMLSRDDAVILDADALAKAKVIAEVTRQGRGRKIRVFKYKRRKNYHRTRGHRQDFTELKIRDIQPDTGLEESVS